MFEGRHNFPKDYDLKIYKLTQQCPHFDLVQTCNRLAGRNTPPDEFCYEKSNISIDNNFGQPLETEDFVSKASCAISNRILTFELEFVKRRIDPLNENEYLRKMDRALSIEEKGLIWGEIENNRKSVSRRTEIIQRWREIIFNTYCSAVNDEENQHFRKLSSSKELTEEEIIDIVSKFRDAIQKIVDHPKDTLECFSTKL